jgi:hypothetical protein
MLLSLGIMLLFGCNWIKLSGAGALGVLTTAFVAAHGWTEKGKVFLRLFAFILTTRQGQKTIESTRQNRKKLSFLLLLFDVAIRYLQ